MIENNDIYPGGNTMNKPEFITMVAEKTGLTKKQVSAALEAALDVIQDAVADGDKVSFTGFGTFEKRERPARTLSNPWTKEEISIPASFIPAFKPGKVFKDKVKQK